MMPNLLSTLRSLADAFLMGRPDRVDTATRMALDADLSGSGERSGPEREAAENVDPIDELKRLVGEQQPDTPPPKVFDASGPSPTAQRPIAPYG